MPGIEQENILSLGTVSCKKNLVQLSRLLRFSTARVRGKGFIGVTLGKVSCQRYGFKATVMQLVFSMLRSNSSRGLRALR